jgi:hypothetical protein
MPTNPNHLLVEDHDTQGAVIALMRHHINWPAGLENEFNWPAKIEVRRSRDEVLNKAELATKLKESGLQILGFIVDADDDFGGRWDQVKDACRHLGGQPPVNCPPEGLVLDIESKRLGVWIMPDNASGGMLENFCHTLVPDSAKTLWDFARQCTDAARAQGATYKDVHVDKAHIHTWLAWQDSPGERMGNAITKKLLTHGADSALRFVSWFRNLYRV